MPPEEIRLVIDKLDKNHSPYIYHNELQEDKLLFEISNVKENNSLKLTTSQELYNNFLKDLVFVEVNEKYFKISSVYKIKSIDYIEEAEIQAISLNSRFCNDKDYFDITTNRGSLLKLLSNLISEIKVYIFEGDIAKKWWYSAFNKVINSYDFDLNFKNNKNIIWKANIPNNFNSSSIISESFNYLDNDRGKLKEFLDKLNENRDILIEINKFNGQFRN